MIIEDDPMVRDINVKFLKEIQGFELVGAVGNLIDARSFIKKQKLDLILLDIYLPKENGIDFLKWLRENEINVEVILITADNTINRIQEAFRYGARDYLIKPFTLQRFKEALLKFKDMYNNFKSVNEIDQIQLDKYISSSKELIQEVKANNNDMVKGLNSYTYKIIWQQVEKAGETYITAERLAEILGIARVTVRRYLDYMNKEKKLERIIEYGKIGRPKHKYKIIQVIDNIIK